jgi:hypothetical protein
VNWSAGDFADVPLDVVTVTSTWPVPGGDTAVMEVGEFTVKEAAGVMPNVTAVAPVKPLPRSETLVPPTSEPELGLMPVTASP